MTGGPDQEFRRVTTTELSPMASWHFWVWVIPFTEDVFGGGVASGIVSWLLPQRVTLGVES